MQLIVPIGSTVVMDLFGHSATNGAPLGVDSTITFLSNAIEVASVPPSMPGTNDTAILGIVVVITGTGSTDISVKVTPKNNSGPFEDVATLVVTPTIDGLVAVQLVLRQV